MRVQDLGFRVQGFLFVVHFESKNLVRKFGILVSVSTPCDSQSDGGDALMTELVVVAMVMVPSGAEYSGACCKCRCSGSSK